MQSIEDGESRYTDLGAYAIENLYIDGKGLFDWTTIDADGQLVWEVTFEVCTDLENDKYDDDPIVVFKDDDYIDIIANLIDSYSETSFPSVSQRFRLTYSLKDSSQNSDSVQRIVELRGENSIYPYINFPELELSNEGIPNPNNIENNVAILPPVIWEIEAGVNQPTSAPYVVAWNDLGDDKKDYIETDVELLFLNADGIEQDPPPYLYANTINQYVGFDSGAPKVNYRLMGDNPYYIQYDETNSKYGDPIQIGDIGWRKWSFVILQKMF